MNIKFSKIGRAKFFPKVKLRSMEAYLRTGTKLGPGVKIFVGPNFLFHRSKQEVMFLLEICMSAGHGCIVSFALFAGPVFLNKRKISVIFS